MKKKTWIGSVCLAATALVLVAVLSVGGALAYFTTYATAQGGIQLELGFTQTDIDENVVNGQKEITLENTGDHACFVRFKALTGDAYAGSIRYSEPDGAGRWTPGADGYYYYGEIVKPGEKTSQIHVGFQFPEEEPTSFNIIIIQECTQVLFDENGAPYADWDAKADVRYAAYNQ